MAWIESHQEIAQHPKTRRLARYLAVSIPDAIGRLHLLWWWATNYAPDGDVSGFEAEDLADATMWEGDPSVMLDALKSAGFIDEGGQIHDWQDYAGRLVDKRRQDAERKRASRAASINSDWTSGGRPADVHSPSGVPNQTKPDLTLPDLTGPEEPPPHTPRTSPSRSAGGGGGVRIPLVDLSTESREVLDAWRLAQGLRAPPRLNPTQAAALEDAVADLGSDRLKAACSWAAGEGITQLTKAIRGARTKRERDERTSSDLRNGTGKPPAARGGGGSVRHI